MAVVETQPREVVGTCGRCGEEFSYMRTSGAYRSFCDSCRGRLDRLPAPLPVAPVVAGEPFTVGHFRGWTSLLRLKGDEPFVLEGWQALFVADVFAGFPECWLIVPEGNGKSTLVAVLILYCCEFSAEAAIPVAAAARDQANIIFAQAAGFGRRSPSLQRRFVFKPGLREVVFEKVGYAKIFASDADTGDGIIPTPIEVIDELHRHKNMELYRTWAGKLDKEAAQLVVISTAGEPGSEFEALREGMRQQAEESSVEGCFGRYVGAESVLHEYAVPEGGDVEDLELVNAANPSSRITVESLAAKRRRPSYSLPHWRRLTCNMPTRTVDAAVTEREWAAALAPEGRREIPAGEDVWLGMDFGFVKDTTALVPLWIPEAEFRLFGPAVILEPPGDGSQLSVDVIKRAVLELHDRTPIRCVVLDMTRANDIAQWVQDELGCEMVDRAQTNSFAAMDYERFMEALRNGWLFHCGDEGLRRHVLNAVARLLPGGQSRFERPKESRSVSAELQRQRVIDALTAAAMVHTSAAAMLGVSESEPMFAWG